ncbi:putative N-myristoyl transferase [Trypanosoma cruzi]|uniref:glycylpeptide N-tetradecanoyltransferase n=1 Tax=Trypanosoma cruzi TaxID=5693 RepID=A0A2V2VYL9_TRYCR|nr:putative N-myristoyl transferase [Trypanosoma cruzi]
MAEEGSGLHQFWNTQPVPQSSTDAADTVGPLEAAGTVDDVPTDPVAIASTLEWWSPDMDNKDDVRAIYELLRDNYVEDVESMFRFNYSEDFLRWALTPPGYHSSWHVAVRRKRDQMLMGFVSGIPVTMRMGVPKKVLQKNKNTEKKSRGRRRRIMIIRAKRRSITSNLVRSARSIFFACISYCGRSGWHRFSLRR